MDEDLHDEIHEHHEEAAHHHEQAAKHHREAAKHHKAGHHEKAAHHSKVAHGHHLHATEHHEEAAKLHAEGHSDDDEYAARALKQRQNVRGLRRGAAGGRAETGSDYTGKPDPGELVLSDGPTAKPIV